MSIARKSRPRKQEINCLPLEQHRGQLVIDETDKRIAEASVRYGVAMSSIPVEFDLTGQCAGMYQVRGRQMRIRYNPWIFQRHFEENLINTVTHEVAHYVVDMVNRGRRVRPHGDEWRQVMMDFNVIPEVRHQCDLSGIPVRRQRRFDYECDCQEHALSTVRHNRVVAGRVVYRCKQCGSALQLKPA
ncbi:MAG: protein SprT [marine bacterium B5-7]|nr:MAG: protein SprT [marine bacterium B5-7]